MARPGLRYSHPPMGRRCTAILALALGTATGCGGPDVPDHNGYRSAKARPWRSPTVLQLDDSYETEVDDTVSYARRQRARWYAVDLPGPGDLEVQLSLAELSDERDVDLSLEVLDEGYRVLAKADREEDDAGDDQKTRTVKGVVPGRYYVHVYAPRRLDGSDFTLQVQYRPRAVASASNFPASVAFVGALPDVPTTDDAPAPAPVAKKCRGSRCRKRPPRVAVEDSQPPPRSVRARIAGIIESGKGVQVRINVGASQGIAVGWKGTVVSKDGKPIPGGSFEIARVSPGESFGTVRANVASVTSAKYVKLQPP